MRFPICQSGCVRSTSWRLASKRVVHARAHHARSALQAEEVAVVLAEAERCGESIVRPGTAEWAGTGACTDADGYVWEVAHNPGWTLEAGATDRI